MKTITKMLLSLLMICGLFIPVSAAEKEKGKVYFGDQEITEGIVLEAPNSENGYLNKTYEVPGACNLTVQYQTKSDDGQIQTFTDETVKCDDKGCTVRYKTFGIKEGDPSSAIFTYEVDGTKKTVHFETEGNAPGGTIVSTFMYSYVGDYIVNGKTYTVNYRGNAITINDEVVPNVILGSDDTYDYKLEYDGQTFSFRSRFIEEENESIVTVLANGKQVYRHIMDLEALGIASIDNGLTDDFVKRVTITKGETVEVVAKNVSSLISMEKMSPDCYPVDEEGNWDWDNKYPHEKLDNGSRIRVTFNDLGTYCVGWNYNGKRAHFEFVVVEDKSEVLSQMTEENAKDVIASLQNVETPNNTNVTVEDIEKIESFYPDVVETRYSGNAATGFEVNGLAPALIKYEDAAAGQTVDMKVDELADNLVVDGFGEVLKTFDITVSSANASMSTTDLQIPVVISFTAKDLNVELEAGKEFKMVREHGGVQEVLDVIDNGDGTYSFVTDKFSKYAIVVANKKVDKPSTPSISCAGDKDKNCDGVITCEEEKGKGWIWNNTKKVCEYNPNAYTVVNTGVK